MRSADPDKVIERVGRRIAELRRGRGLTQAQLAEMASISTKFLQRIEAGTENQSIRSLVRFANVLRVPVADLFASPAAVRAVRGRPKKRST